MFDRFNRATNETPDLELIPIMNLFMVLIPFLLMGAAFFHISVVPTSLPAHTPQSSDVPKTPKTVTVNLSLSPESMDLSASSTSLTPEELEGLATTWPVRAGEYDVDGLQKALMEIKDQYPESNTMIVLPHGELEYDKLVSILDRTREVKTDRLRPDGEPVYDELFAVVVFSQFVTEDSTEEPSEEALAGEDGGDGADDADDAEGDEP